MEKEIKEMVSLMKELVAKVTEMHTDLHYELRHIKDRLQQIKL